jgi:predicted acylesterase/phospholipase RssA
MSASNPFSFDIWLNHDGAAIVDFRTPTKCGGRAMNTALVLGGGGALVDFELGVLQYLYSHNIRPQIICGTSVGAINAAKLAEGEGTPQETNRGSKDCRTSGSKI